MYIIQPRFHIRQSSLLWAGVIIGYGLWIVEKKMNNLHAVDIVTCNVGSWWGNRRERDQWGDLGVDGWIILGRISSRWVVGI